MIRTIQARPNSGNYDGFNLLDPNNPIVFTREASLFSFRRRISCCRTESSEAQKQAFFPCENLDDFHCSGCADCSIFTLSCALKQSFFLENRSLHFPIVLHCSMEKVAEEPMAIRRSTDPPMTFHHSLQSALH